MNNPTFLRVTRADASKRALYALGRLKTGAA